MAKIKIVIQSSYAKRVGSDLDWDHCCNRSCKFRKICIACTDESDAKVSDFSFYDYCHIRYISDFTIIGVRNG